jgi:very-short-patch-repair endonuclease
LVLSHDGKPHRILQTFRWEYSGRMFHVTGENGKTLSLTEDHLVLAERRVKHLTPSGQWSGIPHHHIERARAMRRAMSPPEVALWCSLCSNQIGVKFRKQHPVGPYIADFYSHECGLVVEVDGVQHFEREKNHDYDAKRDTFMASLGLTVLRFSSYEVGSNMDGVLASIYRKTRQRTLESDPAKHWSLPGALRSGDVLYAGAELRPIRVKAVYVEECAEVVYGIEAEAAHSCTTGLCVAHD